MTTTNTSTQLAKYHVTPNQVRQAVQHVARLTMNSPELSDTWLDALANATMRAEIYEPGALAAYDPDASREAAGRAGRRGPGTNLRRRRRALRTMTPLHRVCVWMTFEGTLVNCTRPRYILVAATDWDQWR